MGVVELKKLFFAVAILLLAQFCAAAVLNEKKLSESGYSNFIVRGADQNACTEIAFAKDLNQNVPGNYAVFSLHAEFLPVIAEKANATIFLNENTAALETAKATDFENAWFRFVLPNEKLKEQNTLKLCLQTSNTATESRMLSDSMIGTYKMPEFKAENFIKTVDNDAPLVGEEFEITIKLTNTGSEATDINILHMKPEVENNYVQILRGQSTYFNIIKPGETITLKYFAKARKASVMSLPGAVAYYPNIFGERKKIVSNYPIITVAEPEVKVKALFLLKEAMKKVSETTSAQIAVKNEGQNTLYNIAVYLQLPEGIILTNGNIAENIVSLKPKETKFFDLNISSASAGEFELGCKLAYLDYNVTETNCENAKISFEEKTIPAEIIFAGIIVLGSLLVYAFFHFKK